MDVKQSTRRPQGRGARLPPWVRPPPLWAPRGSTDLLLPPIYTYVPRKHPGSNRNTISTTITFCIREIPSWNLRKCDLLIRSDPGDLDPPSKSHEVVARVGAPPQGAPPASWAPRSSTDVLLPPIYTYVPPNDQKRNQNPNSTAATFCIHEIPSWACSGAPPRGH